MKTTLKTQNFKVVKTSHAAAWLDLSILTEQAEIIASYKKAKELDSQFVSELTKYEDKIETKQLAQIKYLWRTYDNKQKEQVLTGFKKLVKDNT